MSDRDTCIVCHRHLLLEVIEMRRRTCDECAVRTGNIVLPPPRRRIAPCGKCNHARLVRCVPRELSGDVAGPMFAAYQLPSEGPVDARSGFGVLEAYICRRCGFVEWYCHDANEIPIGPAYMTEEVDADGDTPYR